MMMKVYESIVRGIRVYNFKRKIQNKDFSLFSSNCNGGILLHDLGLKFNSPTINLWFEAKDFIKYINNLKKYSKLPLIFLEEEEKKLGYPVALLGDEVKIYFQHYNSRKEAEEKWKLRSERINYSNIFIMSTDRDMCTYEDLKNFDKLPYPNKIIFTRKKYPEIKSSFYIKGFENKKEVGMLFEYRNKILMKRYYEDFNFISWFNNKVGERKIK